MIVDDDSDLRGVVASLFGSNYRVLEASDGQEALSLLKTEAPQLMVLDLSMPGMNGLEVLKSALVAHPSLTVIMLTSERDIELARTALDMGAREFVTKPFDVEYLRAEIQRLLYMGKEEPAGHMSYDSPWKIAPSESDAGTSWR